MMRTSLLPILCALLTACGGETAGNEAAAGEVTGEQPAATAGTDPCSLVTAQEVAGVIGEEVVGTERSSNSCRYQTADEMASSVTLEINQTDAAGEMAMARQAAGALSEIGAAAEEQAGGAGADLNAALSQSSEAPKVGDEALFGPNQQLSVRKGGTYVAISPPMMRSRMASGNPMLSDAQKRAMALAIAEKAVSRLP